MNRPFRPLLVLFAGMLAAACAPERPDADPRPEGEAQLAVITSDDTGHWDIAVMDLAGNVQDLVDADLTAPVGIDAHGGGFLVNDSSNIWSVSLSGEVTRFNQEPMPSVVYRVSVDDEDRVTAAEEYDATELDEDGNIISHNYSNGQFCWLDTAHAGNVPAFLDIFGPAVAVWDSEANSMEVVATGVGSGTNILGVDGSGRFYAASNYGDEIWTATDEGVERLGRLSDMGIDAWAIKGIEPAGNDSVFALYDGNEGSGVVEVDRDGNARELFAADGEVWVDMVLF
jgi:hypothetical protein